MNAHFVLETVYEEGLSEYETFDDERNRIQVKKLDKTLDDGGYVNEISSFSHLPPKFFGIETRQFGQSYFKDDDAVHPFLQLKNLILNDKISDCDDKFQCIKYMTHIPHIDSHRHCLEACQHVLKDESIDVSRRHYFFANNDKYSKLNDQLVYDLHSYFFYLSLEKKYPLQFILLTARFIISFYPIESDARDDVLEFILDIADNTNESVWARSECADILYSIGVQDEVVYGMKILQELGHMDQDLNKITVYSDAQNVHNISINDSVRKVVMTLHRDYLLQNRESNLLGNCSLEHLHNAILKSTIVTDEQMTRLQHFFTRLMTDPTRFENLTLVDIFVIVVDKIKSFDDENIKSECFKRLIEEIIDSENTCHTGYVSRLVNVLSGFVEGDNYMLTISPQDELRSAVFARINSSIAALPIYLKEDVLNSLWGEDKSVFKEFYDMYSPEEELREEYKNLLSDEEFSRIYNKAVDNFQSS